MSATCKTCPFFHVVHYDGAPSFYCRREPPRNPTWDVWPSARPDDWCGEHPLRQRDRLAAMAMQGMLAARVTPAGIPEAAYAVADAMLAGRKKGTGRG